jgi:hypothetical protein
LDLGSSQGSGSRRSSGCAFAGMPFVLVNAASQIPRRRMSHIRTVLPLYHFSAVC